MTFPLPRFRLLALLLLAAPCVRAAELPPATESRWVTPLVAQNLDDAAFMQWVNGAETPVVVKGGTQHVIWTRTARCEWDGVTFGRSKTPGLRHLRIAMKSPIPIGAVLVRGTGVLSVLKSDAVYPGNLDDEAAWLPAERIGVAGPSRQTTDREEYAVWILPPSTSTRALRYTHVAALADADYAGWLGAAFVLADRVVNLAPRATVAASANTEFAFRINNGSADGTWNAWDNGKEGSRDVVSSEHPVDVLLTWPREVKIGALCALWAGFSACDVEAYRGPAERHPREAGEADWQSIGHFKDLQNGYPFAVWPNWLDFGKDVTTRALRLRITKATTEGHGHLAGKTQSGRRVWLGELLALAPLGDAPFQSAVPPAAVAADPPPIPIPFTLDRPGFVTLVIDDSDGKRVRNLVSETRFPAGKNIAWWDGMDDLGRDLDAPRHGVYRLPAHLVAPGTYRVRGLVHQGIDLRYEFSVYNAGTPAWPTADRTGGWLTNHTPPQAAVFVPAETAPGGKPLVYLGSYVSEGGDGLAWVDLAGRKQGGVGWVGGTWTGAPFLARDAGPQRVATTFAYVAASWGSDPDPKRPKEKLGEVRLTALTPAGDKPVPKYHFLPQTAGHAAEGDIQWGEQFGGIAAYNGTLVLSMSRLNQLVFIDARTGQARGVAPVTDPRGLAFDSQGRLLVLAGKALYRYRLLSDQGKLAEPERLVAGGLDDPQHVVLDARGNFYISDRGQSHQVKVFDPSGKALHAIGNPGVPKAGPYDPRHMNNPAGMAIDSNDQLWVTECDFQPKRVSVWTLAGKLLKAFYGPAEYGGGGRLDPEDKTRFYYHGMEFRLDWATGRDRLVRVLFRPGPDALQLPDRFTCASQPEMPLYRTRPDGKRQRYFTNCYNSNPTNGASIAVLWIDRDGLAIPVAAFGMANQWKLLQEAAFVPRWPEGVNLAGDYWKNQAMFAWSDLNGDGRVQPDEVVFWKARPGGITVMPDLAIVAARVDQQAIRYPPQRFTAQGVPVYDPARGEVLVAGAQDPTSSGGDQALCDPDGWSIFTVAPKPFAQQSVGGAYRGKPRWAYPSLWPGLHASHEAPPPDRPGEVIGTTRLLGGFLKLKAGDSGLLWCVNGNMGNMYLFTADGLFVAELFRDVRRGVVWGMPIARRNMLLNSISLHDENFWPSITQTADDKVYLVDGARTSLVRVDGLDRIRRLPAQSLSISADDLQRAQAYFVRSESRRQKRQGIGTLKVALRPSAPTVDGKLDDWATADWAPIDRSGVPANFDSHSQPYDVAAAVAVSGDRLYAAFRTADANLLKNSGEIAQAPFKTGGGLDLFLGANPQADDHRQKPAAGDLRLFVTQVKGKTRAVLYRAVVPGATEPVAFSSPWRTIHIDRVEDVSDKVQLAAADGNYELSVPLAVLGLNPQPGDTLRGDLGILRGDGLQTLHRVYWCNKATGIVSDVPSEAELTPQLWGRWQFQAAP